MKTSFAILATIPFVFLGCTNDATESDEAASKPPIMVYDSSAQPNPDVTSSTKELAPFGSEGRDAPMSIRQRSVTDLAKDAPAPISADVTLNSLTNYFNRLAGIDIDLPKVNARLASATG